jgi:prepilin-type N-terminal cleavage/methylation domain-containing protein
MLMKYKNNLLPKDAEVSHSGSSGIYFEQPPLSPFIKGEAERFPPSGNDRSTCWLSPHGFTLLEVLVATAILGIAVAVVLQLFSANLRALASSEDYVSATKMAEAKMREILDDAALAETSFSETTGDGYRIDVSVTNALEERTENLPVKLLEVSMTVHWTKGIKERSLTLRTMKAVRKEQIL